MPEDTAEFGELFAEARTTRLILDEIATKWSVMILMVVCAKPARFNVIKRHLRGVEETPFSEPGRELVLGLGCL